MIISAAVLVKVIWSVYPLFALGAGVQSLSMMLSKKQKGR